jgi:general secretion pathway protein E
MPDLDPKAYEVLTIDDLPKAPLVLSGVSSRFIQENRIIPIEYRNNLLKIAIADPDDRNAIDALRIALSADVVAYKAEADVIDEYLKRFYEQESQNFNRIIDDMGEGSFEFLRDEEEEDVGHLKDLAAEAPIIKLVNTLINRAIESRASDIHIEPFEDEIKVRYRIDGVLSDIESIPKRLQAAIISRVKIMAKLNIAEKRLPQDGRIKLKVGEREIDLRVSTIPILYGEGIVMRILRKEGIVIDLEQLGFDSNTLSTFNELIKKPNGIILVTGPTGSGKTTTLYGALDKINLPGSKIITVEDPIEYHLKGVNQIQVKPQIGLNFTNTLRHIVRQDPDIIMIGEVRDLETAEIAIQSALTGHLVFSTLHTNDAPSAITRLLDMGVEHFLLSSTVRGILAQRLVRVICPSCRELDDSPASREEAVQLGLPDTSRLFRGVGCDKCSGTGYYGRSGIYELLVIDDEIRKMIVRNVDSNQLRAVARKRGMMTLLEYGLQRAVEGLTTLNEVLRVTQEV